MGSTGNGRSSGAPSSSGDTKPATASDMRLRIKHSKDSINYNTNHAKDHLVAVTQAKKQLAKTQTQLKKAVKKQK